MKHEADSLSVGHIVHLSLKKGAVAADGSHQTRLMNRPSLCFLYHFLIQSPSFAIREWSIGENVKETKGTGEP